jgi:hypothetical protein
VSALARSFLEGLGGKGHRHPSQPFVGRGVGQVREVPHQDSREFEEEHRAETEPYSGLGPPLGVPGWRPEDTRAKAADHIRDLFVPTQVVPASGILDEPNILGPQRGKAWDIHRIACTGFTAGSVVLQLPNTFDQLWTFSAAGTQLFGKWQMGIVDPARFYIVATGITGTVSINMSGVEIDLPWLGDYLL